ncbi:MAG: hypothetical protein JRJ45_09390 [Deltaproteobacteria bacterium]|nr:hypothetical protein [Deltaproteobacteria bacterium]
MYRCNTLTILCRAKTTMSMVGSALDTRLLRLIANGIPVALVLVPKNRIQRDEQDGGKAPPSCFFCSPPTPEGAPTPPFGFAKQGERIDR